MRIIIITGSVGTGKTKLAKNLAKKLNFLYLDVNKIIKKYRISEGYDKKRKTKIVDIRKLNKVLISEIKKTKKLLCQGQSNFFGIIIDSHLSHHLPAKYVDLCIVTKCDLGALNRRLKKRKYNLSKIRENLDVEIFDICLNEAKDNKHNILVINTSNI